MFVQQGQGADCWRQAQDPDSYLCRECVPKLAVGLVYAWREAIPRADLPSSATVVDGIGGNTRDDCWYGHSCRYVFVLEGGGAAGLGVRWWDRMVVPGNL